MTIKTTIHEEILEIIDVLSDSGAEKLKSYADFLRQEEIEAAEEAEDIAYIKSLKPEDYENAVTIEEAITEYGGKNASHG